MGVALAQLRPPPRGTLDMVLGSSAEVQVILAITALFSLASWVIVFWKLGQFRRVRRAGVLFAGATERLHRLEEVARAVLRLPDSPYTRMFRQGVAFFHDLRPGALREGGDGGVAAGLSPAQLDALRLMLEKQEEEECHALGAGIVWLAIIATASPLLGLLGTVIGVMNAFLGVARVGSANITAVAPGVAEALITTVAGLAVAIPAVVAYNYFVHRLNAFAAELDGFATEFIGLLAREGRV